MGLENQTRLSEVFSVLNLKGQEKQRKCQIVLKHPMVRTGTYMQFKLEGKDCALGKLKGKGWFSNLLQMEMSSQLGWPGSPRDQAAGKRFGVGSRAAFGAVRFPSLLEGKYKKIRSAPPGYRKCPLRSRNKCIMQVLTPQLNSTNIYWVLTWSLVPCQTLLEYRDE